MNNAVTTQDKGGMLEQVLIKGDLSSLNTEQRTTYYMKVCDSVGLNPLTKPFEYITLNGKLVLYALRACTDQLRSIYSVSVESLDESEKEGVFIVTAKVRNGEGRTDIAKGAVNIAGLKGEALANALMKAETKAKRRATLSICGLGMLDETEVETIPGAIPENSGPTSGEITAKQAHGSARGMKEKYNEIVAKITACNTYGELDAVKEAYRADFATMKSIDGDIFNSLVSVGQRRKEALDTLSDPLPPNLAPDDDGAGQLTPEEEARYAAAERGEPSAYNDPPESVRMHPKGEMGI